MAKKNKLQLQEDCRLISLTSAEAEVMRVIWDLGRPVTVRDVYETIRDQKRVAYTTTMSVMNKLARKGILTQDTSTAAYLYTAAVADVEIAGSVIEGVVDKILGGVADPLIYRLLGNEKKLSKQQAKKLEEILRK